jgi:peptidyl-prolyl cis-trans isomerase D
MMKAMRENTKVILWVVVVAFVVTIFAVWGLDLQGGGGKSGQRSNLLGKINGVGITYGQYQAIYEKLASQARAASSTGGLTYAQQEMIQEQAWDNLVIAVLTEQEIKKLGIVVTDQEVVGFLRTSPPPEIQQYFVDENGNFDFAAYQSALNNPDADWTAVEALARQRIPLLKLNRYLMSQVHVSPDEVRSTYEEENTLITAEYVSFSIDAEDVSDYVPTDDEIRKYYDTHPDEFRAGERAVVEYVKIPIEPAERDVEDVMYTIDTLSDQLAAGEDFAALAKTYSQAPTAEVGGETGFITADQRDKKVMTKVAIMNPGQTSAPIQTDDGVYIVKLLDKEQKGEQTRYNIQEIFIELSAGSQTVDSLSTIAHDLKELADEKGLANAAAEMGLTVATSEPFRKGFPIPGLGFAAPVNRFAFNNEEGTLSGVIGDEHNYYVCRVVRRMEDQELPLDDVRSQIESTLLYERKKLKALRKAEAFYRKGVTMRTNFKEAADIYGYTIQKPKPFRVADPVDGMAPYSPFAYAALGMVNDGVSPPIESRGSYYVIHLIGHSEFDEEAYKAAAPAINDRLKQQKMQTFIAYWYEKLKEEADIEDYRGSF